MKRITLIIWILILSFSSCSEGQKPTINEIAGTWITQDGGELDLKEDGSFLATKLPAGIFIINTPEYDGKYFDCSGTWSIGESSKSSNQLPWFVEFDFSKTYLSNSDIILTDSNVYFGKYVIISGDNLLENNPPWNYLFRWEDEEGGQRYKFIKK